MSNRIAVIGGGELPVFRDVVHGRTALAVFPDQLRTAHGQQRRGHLLQTLQAETLRQRKTPFPRKLRDLARLAVNLLYGQRPAVGTQQYHGQYIRGLDGGNLLYPRTHLKGHTRCE